MGTPTTWRRRGSITFTLRSATYADPQTGVRLLTTFVADLRGNAITGTYTTRLPSGETQTGRWSAQRK